MEINMSANDWLTCENCYEVFHMEDTVEHEGKFICRKCYEEILEEAEWR
jgi:formylmethanofuran dehydrogenase subunit E